MPVYYSSKYTVVLPAEHRCVSTWQKHTFRQDGVVYRVDQLQ
jgi:hypothetical protein